MCRNIRPLYNFEPPATDDEIRAAALQFVRKISGSAKPSAANQAAFNRAVDEIAQASAALLGSLVTTTSPRNREIEAARLTPVRHAASARNESDSLPMEIRTVPLHALTSEQTTQIIELCSEVFRLDYGFYINLDLPRVHVLGYAGERLVAHASWLTRRLRVGAGPWLEAAYVEGVATHADFRRQGYGIRRDAPAARGDWRLRPGHAVAQRTGLVRAAGLRALAGAVIHRQKWCGGSDTG